MSKSELLLAATMTVAATALVWAPAPVLAGKDKAQGDITDANWTGGSSYQYFHWYVDVDSNKPVRTGLNRTYHATSGLTLNHVVNEANTNLAHFHVRYEFAGPPNFPCPGEVDKYWDERFNGAGCSRLSPTTHAYAQHHICYEYALAESDHATGTYTYILPKTAYSSNGPKLRVNPLRIHE